MLYLSTQREPLYRHRGIAPSSSMSSTIWYLVLWFRNETNTLPLARASYHPNRDFVVLWRVGRTRSGDMSGD